MGTLQRRIGPIAIGFYGLLSSIINGLNLAVAQLRLPKHHFNFGYKWLPVCFFSFSIFGLSLNYPYFFTDNSFSLLVFGFVSFFGVIFLILSAMSGMSKYNMLGAMRLISQLLSYELVWSTIIMLFVLSYTSLSLAGVNNFSGGKRVYTSRVFKFPISICPSFCPLTLDWEYEVRFVCFSFATEKYKNGYRLVSIKWYYEVKTY